VANAETAFGRARTGRSESGAKKHKNALEFQALNAYLFHCTLAPFRATQTFPRRRFFRK
jgi:hypothetical protein